MKFAIPADRFTTWTKEQSNCAASSMTLRQLKEKSARPDCPAGEVVKLSHGQTTLVMVAIKS